MLNFLDHNLIRK